MDENGGFLKTITSSALDRYKLSRVAVGQEWSRNYISFSSGRTKSDSELAQLLGGDFFKKEEKISKSLFS